MAQIVVKPEMCGKIIDESHFKFHVEAKAKMIRAINQLKNGVDLIKSLAKQNFSTDKTWLKNTCKDPNVRVLLEIVEEYKKHEHRPSRAKILIPLLEYGIALYASDLYYRERGEWFLFQIIRRSSEMRFCGFFIDPNNWYPKTRNLVKDADGKVTHDYEKSENAPDAPPIEQEYLQWYGIDVTKDIDGINPELVAKIIKENQDWMNDQGLEFKR
jgi:hypothetical protein